MDSSTNRVLVIAEAGVNHNGSVDLAHQLIDLSVQCGADVVKFQTFEPDSLVATGTATVEYQQQTTGMMDQHEMLRRLALDPVAWRELAAHCKDVGIEFMSTAFDDRSLELLVDLDVQRLKIPSGELTNLPFIGRTANAGLPLIISTGMGTLEEVRAASVVAEAAPQRSLLHCVSAYPAPIEEANLRAIATMRAETDCEVGWSDHCKGTVAVTMAVALGATVVERHITLDSGMEGPDHAASDDPDHFANYVAVVRAATSALGDGVKQPSSSEFETRRLARRSWHATRDLDAGDVLTADDVVALRPATGVSPAFNLVGSVLAASVGAGESIRHAVVGLNAVSPVSDREA